MKVTLINPPMSQMEALSVLGITTPPLGLAYLAAVLEEEGYSVRIIDSSVLGLTFSQVKREIEKDQPDVVGVTGTTPTIHEALATVRIAKEVSHNAVTVVGGPHAPFLPVETLKDCPQLDIVCIGEGEQTLLELVQTIERKANLSSVKGIAYRSNGCIAINEPRPLIDDLDSLPFPARHLLPMDRYTILDKRAIIGHIISSRGCPFNCIFCSSSLLFGKRFRARTARNVVDEIEQVVAHYKPQTIEFSDDLFTLNPKRVEAICSEIKRRGLDVAWACSSRVDTISRELLQKMKRAGCFLIYYGVESGSQRILNLMRKGIRIKQAIDAVKWAKHVGIETLGSFIIGFPGETMKDIKKTIAFAKKLGIDYAQFSLATPYPGTELYDVAKSEGLLVTEDWSQYTASIPIIETDNYSRKDLIKIFQRAYVSFYMSPRILLRHLRKGRLSFFLQVIRLAFRRAL